MFSEMMSSFSPSTKILSSLSSIVHVLIAVFFGYFILFKPTLSLDFFLVSAFAVTSKLFAMIFAEDWNVSKKSTIFSTAALASSILVLTQLSAFDIIIGALILILYSIYPICKGRAPFDVVHHGLRYVLLFILGYGSQPFLDETALMSILMIVFISTAGEILAGLGNNGSIRSTASFLGIKRSLAAIVSFIITASMIASFVVNNVIEFPIDINGTFIPFYIIPALALDIFLTVPLIRKFNSNRIEAYHPTRKKEVAALVIISIIILIVFQTGRISTTVTVNSTDYRFNVGIRTFIAGPHSWDVPWIVFDYVNEDNYYYVVFHKEGTLELSQRIDGQYQRNVSWCATPLIPFESHDFQIVLNETSVSVTLDGEYQVTTPRHLAPENSSIIISPSIPEPYGPVWITCTYHITLINQTSTG